MKQVPCLLSSSFITALGDGGTEPSGDGEEFYGCSKEIPPYLVVGVDVRS